MESAAYFLPPNHKEEQGAMWASLRKSISRTTMIQKSQPQEKFAVQWNPRFPDPFPKGKMISAHKKKKLCW